MRHLSILLSLLVVIACTSTTPIPSNDATLAPTLTAPAPTPPARDPASPPANSAPSPTPAATPSAGATLEVIGDGKLVCNSPGGCGAALLLQPFESGPLPSFLDYEAPMQFVTDRPTFERATLLGPVFGAPEYLQAGRWLIALAQTYSSDFATCETPCQSLYFESGTVQLCQAAFDVAALTTGVTVHAHFRSKCSIDINLSTTLVD